MILQLVSMGFLLIFSLPLYSSDRVIASHAQTGEIDRSLYIVTSDRQTRTIPSCWLVHSAKLKELYEKNKQIGSAINPLKLELDADAVSMVGTCINFIERDAVDELRENYLTTLSLEDLIKLYRAAALLTIDSLIDITVNSLAVQFRSIESLSLFMQNSSFLASLKLEDRLRELLRKKILTKDDQRYLRAHLYTDLMGLYRPTHFQLNGTNSVLLVGCANGEKGSADLWNMHDGALLQRIDTAEQVRQVFFCRGPEIITVGSQRVTQWNLITRAQTPLNFQGETASSPWAACQTDDLTMMAFGIDNFLYIVRLGEKSFRKVPFSGVIQKHPYSNNFSPHLFFCGTETPLLLCADSTGKLFFYCTQTGELLAEEKVHTEKITRYLVQGTQCITFSNNGQACTWDGKRDAHKRLLLEDQIPQGGCSISTVGLATPLSAEQLLAFVPRDTTGQDKPFVDSTRHPVAFIIDKQRNLLAYEDGQSFELPCKNTPEQLCMSADRSFFVGGSFDSSLRVSHYSNEQLKNYIGKELSFAQALSLQLLINAMRKHRSTSQGSRIDIATIRHSHLQDLYRSLSPLLKNLLFSSLSEMRSILGNELSESGILNFLPAKSIEDTHSDSSPSSGSSSATQPLNSSRRMVTFKSIEVVAQDNTAAEVVEEIKRGTADPNADSSTSQSGSDDETSSSSKDTALPRGLEKGRSAPDIPTLKTPPIPDAIPDGSEDSSHQIHTADETLLIVDNKQGRPFKKGTSARLLIQRRNTGDQLPQKNHTLAKSSSSQPSSASNSPRLKKNRTKPVRTLSQSDKLTRRSTLPAKVAVITDFVPERVFFDEEQTSSSSSSIPPYASPRAPISQKDHVELSLKYSRGKRAFGLGQFDEAFKIFSSIGEMLDSTPESRNSHWWLGELYLHGLGTTFDFAQAQLHFKAAQNQAEDKELQASACERLGYMAFFGYGQEQNYALAKECFLEALANAKSARTKALSAFRLALIISAEDTLNGEEAHKDEAINSYQSVALVSADVFRNQITVPKSDEHIYHALLGLIYSQGTSTIADNKQAEYHLQEAGKTTNKLLLGEVQLLLGQLLLKGKMNLKKARDSFKKAANQQVNRAAAALAALELGHIYAEGKGKSANPGKARTYYTQAATQHYDLITQSKAATCLGRVGTSVQSTSAKNE